MLDKRDKTILQLKSEGASNHDISIVLFLSPQRVKALSSNIYRKLGVSNSREAVAKARQMGIVQDKKKDNSSGAVKITPAEAKVAELLVQAKSNEVIALELGLEPSTVRKKTSSLLAKLHCKNRIELASTLLQRGIVKIE